MSSVSDFISHKKIDAHNHLNLGMRYASYVPWAGFYIPDFPRKVYKGGLAEMHQIIGEYTRPRATTGKDAQDLITLSVQDAIADGVTILEGSIDIQFVGHCGGLDNFFEMVNRILKKFEGKIDLRPELGLGKLFDKQKIKDWAIPCLESGIFKSLDHYGPEVFEGLEDFKPIYNKAGQLGIKKKAHVGEFSDSKSVRQFIDYFELEEVQHGIGAARADDDETLKYIADNKIRCNVTPASNVMLTAVPSLKEHPIRRMFDAGCRLTICTDDLLFFNRSISEQCQDMVECGLFTQDEIFKIMDSEF